MSPKRIVVLGAGPIGLEAALYGASLGHEVRVFERGRTGENIRRWGHVRLFSPWRMNHSRLGAQLLGAVGGELLDGGQFLTGEGYVRSYLEPVATRGPLSGRVHEQHAVREIGRDLIGKSDLIRGSRADHVFRMLVDSPTGEQIFEADIVIDCSGTYGNHNWMGNGNIPAVGERALSGRIVYELQDIVGAERSVYEGRRVLLVGAGQSAATALDALIELKDTSVIWVCRKQTGAPLQLVPDDPLPERRRLSGLANALAAGANPAVTFLPGTVVERVADHGPRVNVTLRTGQGARLVEVDRILAHVGYTPDNSLYRQLQVHECYATMGPMQLAASLLSAPSADCLKQASAGAESLLNPEPDFYILGAKSYGKNSSFLIQLGLEQVREVYSLIERSPELNLYAA